MFDRSGEDAVRERKSEVATTPCGAMRAPVTTRDSAHTADRRLNRGVLARCVLYQAEQGFADPEDPREGCG